MNPFSRLAVFPMLCLMFLSACVVRVAPSSSAPPPSPPPPAPSQPSSVINAKLGLSAYPGSRLLDFENKRDGSSEVRFTANANLETVNAFFHREISARGWQRTRFEVKSNATKIEARYRRSGDSFKYELDREGNSGRFKLEIDFDNDDDD
jgi:hypothetical protein